MEGIAAFDKEERAERFLATAAIASIEIVDDDFTQLIFEGGFE
jgi:hypothetical protein